MSLKLKNLIVAEQVLAPQWHSTLLKLFQWQATRYSEYTFTSGYRKDDEGIHGVLPLRAYDWSAHSFDQPLSVAEDTNKNWVYDPKRPQYDVCLFHAVCPKCGTNHMWHFVSKCKQCNEPIVTNWHFHNQICDRTILRRK